MTRQSERTPESCDCLCHSPKVVVTGIYSPCCASPGADRSRRVVTLNLPRLVGSRSRIWVALEAATSDPDLSDAHLIVNGRELASISDSAMDELGAVIASACSAEMVDLTDDVVNAVRPDSDEGAGR
ncbi:hypothetical protein [Nocardioides bruguierae]|uniref:hypothetical protein n=1 Tax=Nocardioides bruguierae TaxID=2945102 RepID=UPI00202019AD|nr:hypothetical protein [Nocardioides bruguierae]MCL8026333.1 hypothetical protein [Nocardioides bruguierae]